MRYLIALFPVIPPRTWSEAAMSLGSRTPRTASGFAVLTLAALAGCHAMPVARVAPSPNRPQSTLATASRAALLSATVAMDPPSEMSSIEPVTSPASSLTLAATPDEPSTVASKPQPTPLLDAALERAKGLDDVGVAGRTKPSPPSEPSPDSTPPPEAGPPKPEPIAIAAATIPAAPAPTPDPVESKPKEPEPARPEDLWRDGVRRLGSLARAKLEQSGGSPAPSPWGLRARVLAWLAEPDLDPDLGHREADGVRAVLRALDEAPGEPPRRGDEVRSAVLVLEDKAPLEIVDLRLCSKVEKFGDFEPFEPPVRKAGQPVILYCEVDGLRFEQTSAGFRTRIAAQFEILPEGGGAPILARSLGTAEETCRRRRRDYYVAYRLVLPRPLPPGDYRFRLTVKDLTADRSASREVSFAIARD